MYVLHTSKHMGTGATQIFPYFIDFIWYFLAHLIFSPCTSTENNTFEIKCTI